MPAYVIYPLDSDRDVFTSAIDIMHSLAASKSATKSKPAATKRIRRTAPLGGERLPATYRVFR